MNKEKKAYLIIISILIFFNITAIPLILQVPYTLLNINILQNNEHYTLLNSVKKAVEEIPDNQNISFFTRLSASEVFSNPKEIKNFFTTQFAITPRILNINPKDKYLIGIFNELHYKKIAIPNDYQVIYNGNRVLLLERREND